MAATRQIMPRLAMLGVIALAFSLIFLGFRFASVVSVNEEAQQRMYIEKTFDSTGNSRDIYAQKMKDLQVQVDEIARQVSELTNAASKYINRRTQLEGKMIEGEKELSELRAFVANATRSSTQAMKEFKQMTQERHESLLRDFQKRVDTAVDIVKRLEGEMATFVRSDYARQGSIHRWLVGDVDKDEATSYPTGKAALDALKSIPFDSTMTISWRTECGCTGIALEAMNLVYPLWKAGVNIWLNECDKGCDYKLTKDLQSMIDTMDKTRPRKKKLSYWDTTPAQSIVYDIVVLHIAYAGICSTKDVDNDARYVISRSMYEADTIKKSEVERCNSADINEVWVPSQFNVDTFSSAGVKSHKLFQIGEGIDMYETWNPALYEPGSAKEMDEPLVLKSLGLTANAKKGWNFMSLFKFEQRKNWKGLLLAYLSEFSKSDDVCFFLKTHEGWEGNPEEWIKEYLARLARKKLIDPKNLPCIFLIDSMIDSDMIPRFFNIVDTFILASHAEGWGLPAMEAMAMEVPVVVTDWGGMKQFTTGPNERPSSVDPYGRFPGGYAIKVKDLEPAFGGNGAGNWAVPSVEHLKKIMRYVYSNQDKARATGKIARQKVLKFDRNSVATRILKHFNQIYTDVVLPSKNKTS